MEGWHKVHMHAKHKPGSCLTLFSSESSDKKCSIFRLRAWMCLFTLVLGQQKHHPVRKRRLKLESPFQLTKSRLHLQSGGLVRCAKLHRSSFNLTLWGWAEIGFQAGQGDLRIRLVSKLKSIPALFIHFSHTEDWHKPSSWACVTKNMNTVLWILKK